MRYLRKIVAGIITLLFWIAGFIGVVFGLAAINLLVQTTSGIFNGVLIYDDWREGTGQYQILRAADPNWFWSSIKWGAFDSFVCAIFAWALVSVAIAWTKHRNSN